MNNIRKAWSCFGVAAVAITISLFVVACGAGDLAGPEQTVRQILAAVENKDIDGFWGALDPQFYAAGLAAGMTQEQLKSMLADEVLGDPSTIKFSDVELATEISEDGQTATVTVVSGTATIVEDGETRVEDVEDSDAPKVFDLVLRDGKWYWDISGIAASEDEVPVETVTRVSSKAKGTTGSSDDGRWTTIATLRSADPGWQGWEGTLVSEPFTVSGEARIVLDMSGAGESEGVLPMIIPAEMVPAGDDLTGWLDVIGYDAVPGLIVLASSPIEELPGLDGTYVLFVNAYEAEAAWSLEVQTR